MVCESAAVWLGALCLLYHVTCPPATPPRTSLPSTCMVTTTNTHLALQLLAINHTRHPTAATTPVAAATPVATAAALTTTPGVTHQQLRDEGVHDLGWLVGRGDQHLGGAHVGKVLCAHGTQQFMFTAPVGEAEWTRHSCGHRHVGKSMWARAYGWSACERGHVSGSI